MPGKVHSVIGMRRRRTRGPTSIISKRPPPRGGRDSRLPRQLSTHKSPPVQRWLKRHPGVYFHFIPTSSSWLNLVERWFGEITRDRIRRGTFESVPALVAAINEYLQHYNAAPRRFVWTKSADMIRDKIATCPNPGKHLH
jgi:hypothetical protein